MLEQRQLTNATAPLTPPPDRPPLRRGGQLAAGGRGGHGLGDGVQVERLGLPPPVEVPDAGTDGTAGTPGLVGVGQPGPGDQPGGNIAPALVPHRPDLSRRCRRTVPVRSIGTSCRSIRTHALRTDYYGDC
ncbi:hypothetical protein [Streptomyces sp. SAI-090]|uniref:hypothetical protein n=1 Tax=Streptomyces sp. SAI-090 TaxID=2940545 RepID=UPI002473A688|nr:hypothetical protein [Streptomyces sp. SAI-090]MDH6522021.1 hypothetical protein [Streptomyces sp. SAI-090]